MDLFNSPFSSFETRSLVLSSSVDENSLSIEKIQIVQYSACGFGKAQVNEFSLTLKDEILINVDPVIVYAGSSVSDPTYHVEHSCAECCK